MDVFVAYIAPVLVGIGIGILSGMLGIGGGTVMVPIFRLAFDMSAIMSTATSLFTIIPTSISGAVSHIRAKTCIVSLGVAAGIGGACTSPLGVWLATISPAGLIMAAAALIIGYSAVSKMCIRDSPIWLRVSTAIILPTRNSKTRAVTASAAMRSM